MGELFQIEIPMMKHTILFYFDTFYVWILVREGLRKCFLIWHKCDWFCHLWLIIAKKNPLVFHKLHTTILTTVFRRPSFWTSPLRSPSLYISNLHRCHVERRYYRYSYDTDLVNEWYLLKVIGQYSTFLLLLCVK